MKLDRFLALHLRCSRRSAHHLLASKKICVGGTVTTDSHQEVGRFTRVEADGAILQSAEPRYLMLHKPSGIVSATVDAEHPTAVGLVDEPWAGELHIAGRLDRSSTGLLLLTNDSAWSESLTRAGTKTPKVYHVTTAEPIPPDAPARFAEGFHFPTEGITTLPATLNILGENEAEVTLVEGRYHQIKRMFHRTGNRVVSLHRTSIGPYTLPDDLSPGSWRTIEVTGSNWT